MTRQPSWQQKISSARRVVETNPIKTPRQTSMKLKRMTSNFSTSQRMDGLNEEHLLPVQRATVQLVDEHLVEMEVPLAKLTLTSFKKLLSDLTFYSGVHEVQGLLIKTIRAVLSRCLIWKGSLKEILKFKLSCLATNIILGFSLNHILWNKKEDDLYNFMNLEYQYTRSLRALLYFWLCTFCTD